MVVMLIYAGENFKPNQNVPKVLGVVFRLPPDIIGIPFPLEIILLRVPFSTGCSSGILLSGLQGRQWWQGMGWGSHWD